jgi:CRISPR/Cas system-associated exonuclease Cas4 (RecB family)
MATKMKRQYDNDFPSVTTVLGVLRKIGLENWFKYNTAKFCNDKSEKGKLIGTQIHEAIENHILHNKVSVETEYAEEVTNALKSFMLFQKEHPEILLEWSEIMLTSKIYGYNGTMDCRAMRGTTPLILDWKTGECKKKDAPAIYDEYIYQVSAYVKAYNEAYNQNISTALIVSFAKDKVAYNIYEMGKEEIEASFNEAFLPALKIYNYQKQQKGKKDV